jgi:hypothetical protein
VTDLPCAAASRALGESMMGTASRVRAWILLQQQGPWGTDALTESRLDPAFAKALAARARGAGVRVILIRRPGRGASPLPPACFLAYTGIRSRFVEGRRLDDPGMLLKADLRRLRRGERPGFGDLVEHPLYLVCTNGKHDRCCATYGRPLAAALAGTRGEQVWECSHIGGDRFAANLVCFPHGLYYGWVGPDDGARIIQRYERGLIDLGHYRGRSCVDPATQAAEHFARAQTGLEHVDDLSPVRREATGRQVTVTFADPSDGGLRVRVLTERAEPARHLTCNASGPAPPPAYRLIAIDSDAAA